MVQRPTTPGQFHMWKNADVPRSDVHSPLFEPSATELYYTMSVWYVTECRCTQVRYTPLTNWTQCYTALLHQVSFTCGRMQMYPGQIYSPLPQLNLVVKSPTTPCQFDIWKNADVPRSDIHPSLIEPSATQPYYTRSVSHVEECRCTQVRYTPPPSIEPSG